MHKCQEKYLFYKKKLVLTGYYLNSNMRGYMKNTAKREKETNREYALRVIRENIVKLELAPGSMISEQDIANELNLSRTPVHEAMQELSSTKIIEILPQRGSHVSLIDMDLVRQARLLRMTLEKEVAMDCCDYVTAEDLTKLEENLALQEFYCQRGMLPELIQKDNEFHHQLFCISRNEMLYRVVHAVSIHYDRVRNLEAADQEHSQNTIADHRAILDAVRAGDRARAGYEIENHLGRYLTNVKGLIKKYPEYFVPLEEGSRSAGELPVS